MKAVIYARYSSDNQREESIEGQLRECMAYCKKNDITVLRTYIDRAMSAKTDHRPDFQRMIKDSAKGLFDVIIVWKLDRFARNRYDSAHYKAQLRKYGVKVLSATENISDGPEGIILESMLEGMAEYYSAELSEKVIRGHTENALKCKYNGGTPTFGYIIDKDMQYQIDPCTAPAVLEMFTMYDKGATMKEIVAYMSERGVTTVRGKKIDLNFMARLLKNRKYIGEYSYRHIVTPNGIPAIVPQDLFDRVQQRLAVNRKAPARHKAEDDYLLTTKLFCGTCGAMMVGESGTSSSKGRKYHYYRCVNTKKHRACDAKHKTVRKLPLENAVVNAVMAKIMDDNFAEYVADAVMDIQSRESSVLPALRKQLEEAESGITNMLNAIQMGIINASTKQRLDELEERKKDIELQIIQEEMKHPAVSREDVIYFVCRFRSLDTSKLDARRRLIDSFVNAVTIFDDYILITFNYKEGETRIDFADIESSDLQSVGGPRRSKLCIACSDLFYKSERAHAAAPPFQIEPAALGFDLAKMDTLLFYFPQSSYCNLFRGVAECYAFSCFHDNVSLRDLPAIRHIKGTDAVIVNIDALVGNAILLFSVVHLDTVDQLPLLAERGIFRHLCRVSDHNFYKVIFVFAGKAGSRLTSYKTTCSKKSSRM